ncbi:MAG: hypothetical protein SFX19_00315 [Alphaproteobacteria bacterium]|nr:hypothetical protein [Alphaproteobacteria bacterium]
MSLYLTKQRLPIKQRMTATTEHPLILATRRLMGALDHLERNLQQVTVTHDREVMTEQKLSLFIRENESLKTERENLNKAFSQLTGQYQDLQHVAKTIHGKLDDSARRITQILEG